MIIYCYFAGPNHDWRTSSNTNLTEQCPNAKYVYTLFAFLPYWFRLGQCLNKYFTQNNKPQLWNAGKYFSDILVPFAQIKYFGYQSYTYNTAFWWWFGLHVFASSYSYCWDIYMDWGLLRTKEPGRYGLRDKLNYPTWFYYYAIVSDLILRFTWLITIMPLGNPNSAFNNFQVMSFILILSECFRRAQWSLIRVENEQNNNFEKYRTIPIIPPIVDEDENNLEDLKNAN